MSGPWMCPKCGRIWAWLVQGCGHCNKNPKPPKRQHETVPLGPLAPPRYLPGKAGDGMPTWTPGGPVRFTDTFGGF